MPHKPSLGKSDDDWPYDRLPTPPEQLKPRNAVLDEVFIVHAVPEDRCGDGIWGVFSTWELAQQALEAEGLTAWDPIKSRADDPENEIPRQPDERVIGTYIVDYRITRGVRHGQDQSGGDRQHQGS